MKFLIASLPRSGSTAVSRVVACDHTKQVIYEPPFFGLGAMPRKIRWRARKYLLRADGIKHVWDPNGWPFRNEGHISSITALACSEELISANRAVLESADRIALLRRRNMFDRTLSDLWAQQTQLWGHHPDQPHSLAEAQEYRAAVFRHAPAPIDPLVFGWYMRNAESWETQIVSGISPRRLETFFYEDLFGPTIKTDQIHQSWNRLLLWLDAKVEFLSPAVQKILDPRNKLNSPDLYAIIPNFRYLKDMYCSAH